jgi:hypothetical protein
MLASFQSFLFPGVREAIPVGGRRRSGKLHDADEGSMNSIELDAKAGEQ